MKKGFLLTVSLAFALGIGVAVGAHHSKPVAEADAAPVSTVYCKNVQSWWKADGAAVGAYCWDSKDDSKKNAEWPGVRMTPVTGETDLWTYTIPNGYDKIIFTRVNGSGAIENWGAKTKDLDVPSVKNCYTITTSSAVWGDPGVDGEWSVYPEVAPEYHLLGTFNSWNDSSGDYLLTADAMDSNHFTFSDLELTATAEFKVCDVKNDDWFDNGEGNVTVEEDGTYDIDFYVNADNDVHIVATKEVAEPVYTISCRGNAPVLFELDEEDKPEGVVHQYSASVQYACRGGELEFFRDGTKITSHIGVDAGDAEHINNVYGNAEDGFRIAHTANYSGYTKVYLKTYSDGGISIWGEGYADNVFYSYIRDGQGGGHTEYLYLDKEYKPNETYVRQYKTSSAVAIKALAGTEEATSYFLDCAGIGEDIAPETDATNNARQAYQVSAWTVHNDCEEVIYVKEKASDLSLVMYIGGYEESHILTIGGKQIPLTRKDENQYWATGVSLQAGDKVTGYTIEGVAQTVTSKKVGCNNLNESMEVIVNTTADIYYDVDNKTLFISGLPTGGYHIIKNGNTLVQMEEAEEFEGFLQYKSELISFAVDDSIQFVDCNAAEGVGYPTIWCIQKINEGGLRANFDYDTETDSIVCKTKCDSAVYMKLKSGADEIYFGDVPEYVSEAVAYANKFKSSMATTCASSEDKKQGNVEEAWSSLNGDFNELSEKAQAEIKKGSSSKYTEIRELHERYDAIRAQHPTWELADFITWDAPANGRNPVAVSENTISDNNMMIIVIAIASTSVLALSTLIIIKKKRHQ